MTVHTNHKTHDRYTTRALDPSLSQSIHNRQKYHLRAGGMYLHQGGGKLQPSRQYAWTGTIEQAAAMRRTFSAAAGCTAIPQDDPTHSEAGE